MAEQDSTQGGTQDTRTGQAGEEQATQQGGQHAAQEGGEQAGQQTGEQGGAAHGNRQESGETQPRGDPSVALRQERERRRRLERQLEAIRTGSQQMEGGEQPTAPQLELSDEDLDDAESLQTKVNEHVQNAVQNATAQVREQLEASQTVSNEVQQLLDHYNVFNLDDPISEDATRAAAEALGELPAGATMDQARETIGNVAKRFDAYRAGQAGTPTSEQSGESEEAGPVSVGAGSPESAHFNPQAAPASSMREAGRRARQEFQQRVRRRTG